VAPRTNALNLLGIRAYHETGAWSSIPAVPAIMGELCDEVSMGCPAGGFTRPVVGKILVADRTRS